MYLRTRIEHTSWQSSMQEFGINVEASDVIEVKTEQEIHIRTITEITTFSNYMKNVNVNKFNCQVCHADFDNYEEFIVHKNLTHKSKPYVCNVCNAKFILSAHLNTHKRDNYLCMANPSTSFANIPISSQSSSSINSSRNYRTSELLIKSETSAQQNELSDSTQNICVMNPNITLQNTKCKSFKCVNCVFVTESETEFLNHLDICNNISKSSSEVHQCNLCTKSFKSQSSLDDHLKYHADRSKILKRKLIFDEKNGENQNKIGRNVKSQNYVSNIENRNQKTKDCNKYITTHNKSNIHSEQLKQQMICDICHKKFVSKTGFKKHMLLHRNVKMSNGGTKIIKSSGEKSDKQKISQNKKSFQCSNCNTYYKSKLSLSQHIRQHHSHFKLPQKKLKLKTVKCNWCGIIITKHNLFRHITSFHHDINSIRCCFCQMTLNDYNSLILHKTEFHYLKA